MRQDVAGQGGFWGHPERKPGPGPSPGALHLALLPQVQLPGAGLRQAVRVGLPHGGVQLHGHLRLCQQHRPERGQDLDQLHRVRLLQGVSSPDPGAHSFSCPRDDYRASCPRSVPQLPLSQSPPPVLAG